MAKPHSLMTRRNALVVLAGAVVAGCQTSQQQAMRLDADGNPLPQIPSEFLTMYGPVPDERFPIPAVDLTKIDPIYFRRQVDYVNPEPTGTIVVNTSEKFLYLTMPEGKAMRYGIGVGREGFEWGGRARIPFKRQWPTWTPPAEMIEREPELEQYRNGMEPGLENPLGARALYLFEGGRDTLYRLHGTNEDWSIGREVSSGCIRLLNQDVIDLYNRVPNGTKVVVEHTPSIIPVAAA